MSKRYIIFNVVFLFEPVQFVAEFKCYFLQDLFTQHGANLMIITGKVFPLRAGQKENDNTWSPEDHLSTWDAQVEWVSSGKYNEIRWSSKNTWPLVKSISFLKNKRRGTGTEHLLLLSSSLAYEASGQRHQNSSTSNALKNKNKKWWSYQENSRQWRL